MELTGWEAQHTSKGANKAALFYIESVSSKLKFLLVSCSSTSRVGIVVGTNWLGSSTHFKGSEQSCFVLY